MLNYKKPAFWIMVVAIVACVTVAVCFLTNPQSENPGQSDLNKLTQEQLALKEEFPEYFGLDDSKGLDVYVWQLAPSSYYFGVLPHSEQERSSLELMNFKSANTEQMRTILSTYRVDKEKIYVIPWQNPISSYLSPWMIMTDPQNTGTIKRDYINYVRKLLFGEEGLRTSVYGSYGLANDKDILGFSITLHGDGTYTYFEGVFSSHIGYGEYTYENGIVTLVDTHVPGVDSSLTLTFKFLFQDGSLFYMAEESDDFMYRTLPDGAEFEFVGF